MPQQKEPKHGDTTYDWIMGSNRKVRCFKGTAARCIINPGLWEAEVSAFHDERLQSATREINGILAGIENEVKGESRHLHYIKFEERLMLVWCDCDEGHIVSSSDEPAEVAKALKVHIS
jgi:hypothetical protein